MGTMRHFRQRRARWQSDATNRHLLRQQLRRQRRQRLRWNLHQRWEHRPRANLRQRWEHRPEWNLHQHWEHRPRANLRQRWDHRPRANLRQHWEHRPEWNLRQHWEHRPRANLRQHWDHRPRANLRRWVRFDGRSVRRVAVITTVLLLGSGAGYAAIRAGGPGSGSPTAQDTARPAADHPPRGNSPRRVPGLTTLGVFHSVALTDGGRVEVAERARTPAPLDELSLLPPPAQDGARALPRLKDFRLYADGERVTAPTTIEVTTVIKLDRSATVFELRYRVVGAAARRKPAAPGRATLSLRPALAPSLDLVRAVVEVRGVKVHNLVCVDLRRKAQLCGTKRGDGWRTRRLPVASSAVVALVDLRDRSA